MLILMKNMTKNTICIVQELHTFLFRAVLQITSFPSIFPLHSSTSLSTFFFYSYNFHNPNIFEDHMIYHTHIHNY